MSAIILIHLAAEDKQVNKPAYSKQTASKEIKDTPSEFAKIELMCSKSTKEPPKKVAASLLFITMHFIG